MDIYGSVGALKTYVIARGIDIPADRDDDELATDLLVASEHLDRIYGGRFSGIKSGGREQSREWPRIGAFDNTGHVFGSDVIPQEVVSAALEIAIRNARAPGSLMTDYTPSKYEQVSVEGAVSVKFAGFSGAADAQMQIPIVGSLLSRLLTGGAVGVGSSFSGSSVRG